eukprot:g19071.t1
MFLLQKVGQTYEYASNGRNKGSRYLWRAVVLRGAVGGEGQRQVGAAPGLGASTSACYTVTLWFLTSVHTVHDAYESALNARVPEADWRKKIQADELETDIKEAIAKGRRGGLWTGVEDDDLDLGPHRRDPFVLATLAAMAGCRGGGAMRDQMLSKMGDRDFRSRLVQGARVRDAIAQAVGLRGHTSLPLLLRGRRETNEQSFELAAKRFMTMVNASGAPTGAPQSVLDPFFERQRMWFQRQGFRNRFGILASGKMVEADGTFADTVKRHKLVFLTGLAGTGKSTELLWQTLANWKKVFVIARQKGLQTELRRQGKGRKARGKAVAQGVQKTSRALVYEWYEEEWGSPATYDVFRFFAAICQKFWVGRAGEEDGDYEDHLARPLPADDCRQRLLDMANRSTNHFLPQLRESTARAMGYEDENQAKAELRKDGGPPAPSTADLLSPWVDCFLAFRTEMPQILLMEVARKQAQAGTSTGLERERFRSLQDRTLAGFTNEQLTTWAAAHGLALDAPEPEEGAWGGQRQHHWDESDDEVAGPTETLLVVDEAQNLSDMELLFYLALAARIEGLRLVFGIDIHQQLATGPRDKIALLTALLSSSMGLRTLPRETRAALDVDIGVPAVHRLTTVWRTPERLLPLVEKLVRWRAKLVGLSLSTCSGRGARAAGAGGLADGDGRGGRDATSSPLLAAPPAEDKVEEGSTSEDDKHKSGAPPLRRRGSLAIVRATSFSDDHVADAIYQQSGGKIEKSTLAKTLLPNVVKIVVGSRKELEARRDLSSTVLSVAEVQGLEFGVVLIFLPHQVEQQLQLQKSEKTSSQCAGTSRSRAKRATKQQLGDWLAQLFIAFTRANSGIIVVGQNASTSSQQTPAFSGAGKLKHQQESASTPKLLLGEPFSELLHGAVWPSPFSPTDEGERGRAAGSATAPPVLHILTEAQEKWESTLFTLLQGAGSPGTSALARELFRKHVLPRWKTSAAWMRIFRGGSASFDDTAMEVEDSGDTVMEGADEGGPRPSQTAEAHQLTWGVDRVSGKRVTLDGTGVLRGFILQEVEHFLRANDIEAVFSVNGGRGRGVPVPNVPQIRGVFSLDELARLAKVAQRSSLEDLGPQEGRGHDGADEDKDSSLEDFGAVAYEEQRKMKRVENVDVDEAKRKKRDAQEEGGGHKDKQNPPAKEASTDEQKSKATKSSSAAPIFGMPRGFLERQHKMKPKEGRDPRRQSSSAGGPASASALASAAIRFYSEHTGLPELKRKAVRAKAAPVSLVDHLPNKHIKQECRNSGWTCPWMRSVLSRKPPSASVIFFSWRSRKNASPGNALPAAPLVLFAGAAAEGRAPLYVLSRQTSQRSDWELPAMVANFRSESRRAREALAEQVRRHDSDGHGAGAFSSGTDTDFHDRCLSMGIWAEMGMDWALPADEGATVRRGTGARASTAAESFDKMLLLPPPEEPFSRYKVEVKQADGDGNELEHDLLTPLRVLRRPAFYAPRGFLVGAMEAQWEARQGTRGEQLLLQKMFEDAGGDVDEDVDEKRKMDNMDMLTRSFWAGPGPAPTARRQHTLHRSDDGRGADFLVVHAPAASSLGASTAHLGAELPLPHHRAAFLAGVWQLLADGGIAVIAAYATDSARERDAALTPGPRAAVGGQKQVDTRLPQHVNELLKTASVQTTINWPTEAGKEEVKVSVSFSNAYVQEVSGDGADDDKAKVFLLVLQK